MEILYFKEELMIYFHLFEMKGYRVREPIVERINFRMTHFSLNFHAVGSGLCFKINHSRFRLTLEGAIWIPLLAFYLMKLSIYRNTNAE